MWTNEEIASYTAFLDKQEQLVLQAIELGYDSIEDVENYVQLKLCTVNADYVEMIYNLIKHPERKVSLEVL